MSTSCGLYRSNSASKSSRGAEYGHAVDTPSNLLVSSSTTRSAGTHMTVRLHVANHQFTGVAAQTRVLVAGTQGTNSAMIRRVSRTPPSMNSNRSASVMKIDRG